VLLVEDHPRNARLVEQMLAVDGYVMEHAVDGTAAVEHALAAPPDVVLLDLELPGIDGFEVARRLRADARTARVPIIAVTARALPAEEARARAIGCDDFVTKPLDMARLRAAVRAVLRQDGA
jgi:DNA-binding response OmpR family regulator